MKLRSTIYFIVLSLLSSVSWAKDDTLEQYKEIFSSTNSVTQQKAIKKLAISGLNSPEIYDVIEQNIKTNLPLAKDKHKLNDMAYLVRALAYSGNDKYVSFINSLMDRNQPRKIRGHAQKAKVELYKYKMWNKVLNAGKDSRPSQDQRLINAFKSNDVSLMEISARKMIELNLDNDSVLDVIGEELKSARLLVHDRQAISAYAYMAKAIATTSKPKYKPLLEELKTTIPHKKVRKYISKYLKKYY